MEALQLLFNDVEQYKGYIHIGCKSANGFSELCARRIDRIDNFVRSMITSKTIDYYITANAMKTAKERNNSAVLGLNNIVIDIDIHNTIEDIDRENIINEFVFRLKRDLTVPLPNVIHKTGRGVQAWWHLEQAASVLAFLYHKIVDRLEVAINAIIAEYSELSALAVDKTASGNISGYYRLFGTVNTHTHTVTEWEVIHRKSYNISDLLAIVESDDNVQDELHRIESEQKKHAPQMMCFTTSYIALQRKRINLIEWLIEYRQYDCTGSRDVMLFLHYNACIQLYNPSVAKELTETLNAKFAEPLKSIDYIYKLFDRNNKYYRFKNSTFEEWLYITSDEKEAFKENHITQNAARTAEREGRKVDKKKRKQLIYDMLMTGHYTLQEIAEQTGYSLRTVERMSSTVNKPQSEAKLKPWEAMGISRRTYYRNKKQGL